MLAKQTAVRLFTGIIEMKTYEIEIRYTAYSNQTIEAASAKEAEALAWAAIEANPDLAHQYGEWECLDVEEVKP